jgi:hypothetical protein
METALILCHARLPGISRKALLHDWAARRAQAVAAKAGPLGLAGYRQVQQVSRWNIVYNAARLSRSWPVTTAISILKKQRLSLPRLSTDENWDLVEFFVWSDAEVALPAIESTQFTELTRDADARVANTQAVLCRQHHTALAPVPPRAATLYVFRRRPQLTPEGMTSYWLDRHGPFVLGLQPDTGFIGYDQNVSVSEGRMPGFRGSRFGPIEAVADLGFTGLDAIAAGLLRPRTFLANLKLVWDETGFIDAGRSTLVMGEVRHEMTFSA